MKPFLRPTLSQRSHRLWLVVLLPALLLTQLLLSMHGVQHGWPARTQMDRAHHDGFAAQSPSAVTPTAQGVLDHTEGGDLCHWLDHALASHLPLSAGAGGQALAMAPTQALAPAIARPRRADPALGYVARGPPVTPTA